MSAKRRRIYGTGSIVYREDKKRWMGRKDIGIDENGKRKIKTVYGKTKSECERKLKQAEFDIYAGKITLQSSVTLYELAMQIENEKLDLGHIQEQTYFRDVETLKRMKTIYSEPVQELNETILRRYLATQVDAADSTIKKVYTLMKRVFTEAVHRKIIRENPMDYIKRPRSKKQMPKTRALTVIEQQKLYEVFKTKDVKYKDQMIISVLTGMRMGEVNALTLDAVNLPFRRIVVRKTISRGLRGEARVNDAPKTIAGNRMVEITDDLFKVLDQAVDKCRERNKFVKQENQGECLLFVGEEDKPIPTALVNQEFQKILRKNDILDPSNDILGKVSLHSLRHTYATRMIEAGVDALALRDMLGHTDIQVTINTYCDAFEEYKRKNVQKANAYLEEIGLNIV